MIPAQLCQQRGDSWTHWPLVTVQTCACTPKHTRTHTVAQNTDSIVATLEAFRDGESSPY